MGFTVKVKSLLPQEQILSFISIPQLRREAKMKMAELLPVILMLSMICHDTKSYYLKYNVDAISDNVTISIQLL